MTETPPGRLRSLLRWLILALYAGHAALVWLLILRPPRVPPGIELDASWKQLVGLDFHAAIQAGVDFVFTYGPLGYFLVPSPTYEPDWFWSRVIADMGVKAFVVVAILSPVLRMRRVWHRFVYLAAVLIAAPIADDAFALMAITAATVSLILGRCGLHLVLPVVAVFAALGMAKFTLFTLGAGCVALLMVSVWHRAGWRHGGWRHGLAVPATFVAAFALIWVAIGQSVWNLPAFLEGSLEIAAGYNESMRWVADYETEYHFDDILIALVAIGLTAAAALMTCLHRPWRLQRLLATGAVAATLFIGWKSGFVRQDSGHALICFCCAALVPLWLWSFADRPRRSVLRDVTVILATVTAFAGAFRIEGTVMYRPDHVVPSLAGQARAHWNHVADLPAAKARLDAMLQHAETRHELPGVRVIVGDAPIDEVPHGQSILFLNDLNVRHRPVFQSYSAYTPYLQKLNGDFYEDESTAPRFVLFRLEAIDGQLPTVADSQIYRTLLRGYRPCSFERGYLLLERTGGVSAPPVSGRPGEREIDARTARLGEWVPIAPGTGTGELAIDLGFSWLGSLWNLGFRGPRLYLDVRLDTGKEIEGFVTSRGAMQLPFLVDPFVRDTSSFARLYAGAGKLPRVTAFRLRPQHGREHLYVPEFRCTFWRSSLPPPLDEAAVRELRIDYQMFDRAPRSIEPEQSFRVFHEGPELVQIAEAPSAMTFDGLGGSVTVSGKFGIRRPAYTDGGRTDGVTFRIDRLDAAGTTRTLFERRLDPRRTAADRGVQGFALEANLGPGAVLVFRTLPGADTRWDWSYWTDLRFRTAGVRNTAAPFSADVSEIRLADGGTQRFTLDAGSGFANLDYMIAGTLAGTEPGFVVLGMQVPLNPTAYTNLTLSNANTPVFDGFRGRLDGDGRAKATLRLPRLDVPGAGELELHHAFAVVDGEGRIFMVSNPVALRLR